MTRMTGPDCVVRCNLINTYIHTDIHTYIHADDFGLFITFKLYWCFWSCFIGILRVVCSAKKQIQMCVFFLIAYIAPVFSAYYSHFIPLVGVGKRGAY